MKARPTRSLFLLLFAACGASTDLDAGFDVGADAVVADVGFADGGADASADVLPDVLPDVPVADCTPHEFRGCSDSAYHWFWTGRDCEVIFECSGMGHTSRRSCLEAHVGCGGPDRCSGMAAEEIVIACPELPGYAWNGSECTRIECCEGDACDALFASESECTGEYSSCGVEDTCGPEFVLGYNETPAVRIDDAAPDAAGCLETPGDAWLARAVFRAPTRGTYVVEAYPAIAFGGFTDVAIFSGRCTNERRSCFSGEGGGGARVSLREGELITILVKPEYALGDGDPVGFFSRIDVQITLEEE